MTPLSQRLENVARATALKIKVFPMESVSCRKNLQRGKVGNDLHCVIKLEAAPQYLAQSLGRRQSEQVWEVGGLIRDNDRRAVTGPREGDREVRDCHVGPISGGGSRDDQRCRLVAEPGHQRVSQLTERFRARGVRFKQWSSAPLGARHVGEHRQPEPPLDGAPVVAAPVAAFEQVETGQTDEQAERKAAQAGAPIYKYYFTWRSPVRDGKLKSYHCIDIPFAFNNVDVAASMIGGGQDRYALADAVSGAFAAFARSGDPNHAGIPNWKAFNARERATLIFDTESRLVMDPHGAERRARAALQGRA